MRVHTQTHTQYQYFRLEGKEEKMRKRERKEGKKKGRMGGRDGDSGEGNWPTDPLTAT